MKLFRKVILATLHGVMNADARHNRPPARIEHRPGVDPLCGRPWVDHVVVRGPARVTCVCPE